MANMFLSRLKQGDVQVDYLTVTSMPTKTQYLVDDTLDLTGMVITATFTDGVTADVTSAVTTIPADGATLSTEGTQAVIVTYGKATVSFNVTVSDLPASLEDATWAQIQTAVQNGTLSQFASVGDTKSFVINNKTYHAEVVAINDGTGSAGSWYPDKTVDFITKELYTTKYRYNATNNNSGGFPSSEIKTTLNSTIYPLLPSDLKSVITAKSHSYQAGSYSSSWSSSMVTSSDNLWLPTYYEIAGGSAQFAEGENVNNNKPYILDSKIKMVNGESSASRWWLGSPYSINSGNFWAVTTGGGFGNDSVPTANGVPLCFRIG